MMKLNDRQVAFLVVMQDGRERGSGWIFHDAFPDAEHRGRRDAGATRTLDGMDRLGLVAGRYLSFGGGRNWRITTAGRTELRKRGLLAPPKKIGLIDSQPGGSDG